MAARFSELLSSFNLRVLCPHDLHERLSEDELLAIAGSYDATICGDDAYSERVLAASSPRLKVIAKWGTGIDSIDKAYAQSVGVAVTNTLGAFTDPVADTTLAYMLMFARNVAATYADMKAGSWVKLPGKSLRECTVGLVGCGSIGQAVCARLRGFGARVLFVDPVAPPPAFMEANRHVSAVASLSDMLPQCHFVCMCCDLNPSSKHILNSATLACMRPDAVLINAARGPLVDEAALVAALESGGIAGAAMDVFEHEPLAKDSPLLSMRNVVLAPHNGALQHHQGHAEGAGHPVRGGAAQRSLARSPPRNMRTQCCARQRGYTSSLESSPSPLQVSLCRSRWPSWCRYRLSTATSAACPPSSASTTQRSRTQQQAPQPPNQTPRPPPRLWRPGWATCLCLGNVRRLLLQALLQCVLVLQVFSLAASH
jgi:D-3-phosphoglycerate dehydrogenase